MYPIFGVVLGSFIQVLCFISYVFVLGRCCMKSPVVIVDESICKCFSFLCVSSSCYLDLLVPGFSFSHVSSVWFALVMLFCLASHSLLRLCCILLWICVVRVLRRSLWTGFPVFWYFPVSDECLEIGIRVVCNCYANGMGSFWIGMCNFSL